MGRRFLESQSSLDDVDVAACIARLEGIVRPAGPGPKLSEDQRHGATLTAQASTDDRLNRAVPLPEGARSASAALLAASTVRAGAEARALYRGDGGSGPPWQQLHDPFNKVLVDQSDRGQNVKPMLLSSRLRHVLIHRRILFIDQSGERQALDRLRWPEFFQNPLLTRVLEAGCLYSV